MHPTGSPEWGNEPERGVIGRGAVHQDEWRTCSFAPARDRGAVSRAYPTSRPRSWRVILCPAPLPLLRAQRDVVHRGVITDGGHGPAELLGDLLRRHVHVPRQPSKDLPFRPSPWLPVVLRCHETPSSISTPSPIRRLWSVLYAFVLTEDGGAPSRTHVGPDPRLSAAERMHLRGCNDVPMLGVNDVSIHHSRALGLTQYEPKPAGRAPDGRACSGSQQGPQGWIRNVETTL